MSLRLSRLWLALAPIFLPHRTRLHAHTCTPASTRGVRAAAAYRPPPAAQVMSCLHLFRHRPSQQWMAGYVAAVEGCLPRFSAVEQARLLALLDNLNQRPSDAFMLRFFDASRCGAERRGGCERSMGRMGHGARACLVGGACGAPT